MNKYAKWFSITMWIGIVFNILLGLPTILFPNTMLRLLHQRPSTDIVWTAFAGLLIVMLGLLYIPAAKDPIRYRSLAKTAVFVRFCEALFFLIIWPGRYPLFGLLDGLFFIVQWIFLFLALREHDRFGSSS